MELRGAQIGDISVGAMAARDVVSTLTSISVGQDAMALLIADVRERLTRLERAQIAERHLVGLNAAASLLLFASALLRWRTGVRRTNA
jgi:hypothetical protein